MRPIELCGLAILYVAAGCGPGLDGPDAALPPLFVVKGHLDWDEERFLAAYAERLQLAGPVTLADLGFTLDDLRVAFAWAGQPSRLDVCVRTDAPEVLDACVDPSWFRIGASAAESAVDPVGFEFEVAVDTLPEARLTVGGPRSRIAFGSLIAFFEPRELDVGGEELGDVRRFHRGETIVGASFAVPSGSSHRVAYREGRWPSASVFYPLPATCPKPPRGVSIVRTGASDCSIVAVTTPVTVPVLGAAQAAHLECSATEDHVIISASDALWLTGGDDRPGVCVDANTYVIPATDGCPYLEIYELAGCYAAEVCERLEWDLRDSPPSSWPCTGAP